MARALLIPDPENAWIEELKQLSRIGSSETATRCTAIQMLLAGASRELVCDALLVTNRALRKWINCFNQAGVDGLIVKKRPGRMSIMTDQQAPELAQLIDKPEKAKRGLWTAKAFHGYIGETYQIQCSDETMVRFFHKHGFALKTPQPWPDMQDEQLRAAFVLELQTLFEQPDVDVWFADESGFEADRQISFQRTTNILVMDNASWHKRKRTNWHGWKPMYLPPYSTDLNPIERIWLTMKARWFNNHVCKNEEKLIERLDQAILDVIDNPDAIKQTAAIGTLF